jgi:hypothetical protein
LVHAKRTIQAAVDAAAWGDTVYVADGVYDEGGQALYGDYTNRVVIDKDVTVVSVNGPAHALIVGRAGDDGGNSTGAVRCVYISTGLLSGFTITNGHTYATGDWGAYQRGGGVILYQGGTVSNCVIRGNSANITGGGVDFHYGGVVADCLIEGNSSSYGGGGVSLHRGALLDRCVVRGNTASGNYTQDGGGLYFYSGGTARNCLIAGNWAEDSGGGIYVRAAATNALLENCTVVTNVASFCGGVYLNDGTNRNCVIYHNRALMEEGDNWETGNGNPQFEYCCITPMTGLSEHGGRGLLRCGSPVRRCRRLPPAGRIALYQCRPEPPWMSGATDLDGVSRVRVGIVDVGAYEYMWCERGNEISLNGTNAFVNIEHADSLNVGKHRHRRGLGQADPPHGPLRRVLDAREQPAGLVPA